MTTHDQREELLAANPSAFSFGHRAGSGQHDVHPAGQHSHGVPTAERVQPMLDMNGGALDTLLKLIERGPQTVGDIPSKAGLNELLAWGLAVQIVGGDAEYRFAATTDGRDAYCYRYGADTLVDAKQRRQRGESRLGMVLHAVAVGTAIIGRVRAPLGSDGTAVVIRVDGYQGGLIPGHLVAIQPETGAAV